MLQFCFVNSIPGLSTFSALSRFPKGLNDAQNFKGMPKDELFEIPPVLQLHLNRLTGNLLLVT